MASTRTKKEPFASRARTKKTTPRKPPIAEHIDLPLISVITPSFNQGKFIERTIESVLGQSYPRLEYIVIDGGSTDETIDILKKYGDRIKWISERDSGQSNAINKGFKMATGEIVGWLNSDDVYLPGSLMEVGKHFASHPGVMMVYGEGYMIDEHDNIKSPFPFTEPRFDLWKLIYYGDYILQQTTFYRRKVFDTLGFLDEELYYGMDWDLFIRIGKRYRVDYLPHYLGSIREHGEAKTSTGGFKRFRELVGLIRRHGIYRYPQAYFNYAWDVVGAPSSATADGDKSVVNTLLRSAAPVLKRLIPIFLKHSQQGCFADGWIAGKAMVVLPNENPSESSKHLSVVGEFCAPNTPLEVSISVNKKTLIRTQIAQAGLVTLNAPLTETLASADAFHVEIISSKEFVPSGLGISEDPRSLAFLLKSITVTTQD